MDHFGVGEVPLEDTDIRGRAEKDDLQVAVFLHRVTHHQQQQVAQDFPVMHFVLGKTRPEHLRRESWLGIKTLFSEKKTFFKKVFFCFFFHF